jgi:hypothetical protein
MTGMGQFTTHSDRPVMSGIRPNRIGQAGLLMSGDRDRPEVSAIRSSRSVQPVEDMNLLLIDGHL